MSAQPHPGNDSERPADRFSFSGEPVHEDAFYARLEAETQGADAGDGGREHGPVVGDSQASAGDRHPRTSAQLPDSWSAGPKRRGLLGRRRTGDFRSFDAEASQGSGTDRPRRSPRTPEPEPVATPEVPRPRLAPTRDETVLLDPPDGVDLGFMTPALRARLRGDASVGPTHASTPPPNAGASVDDAVALARRSDTVEITPLSPPRQDEHRAAASAHRDRPDREGRVEGRSGGDGSGGRAISRDRVELVWGPEKDLEARHAASSSGGVAGTVVRPDRPPSLVPDRTSPIARPDRPPGAAGQGGVGSGARPDRPATAYTPARLPAAAPARLREVALATQRAEPAIREEIWGGVTTTVRPAPKPRGRDPMLVSSLAERIVDPFAPTSRNHVEAQFFGPTETSERSNDLIPQEDPATRREIRRWRRSPAHSAETDPHAARRFLFAAGRHWAVD